MDVDAHPLRLSLFAYLYRHGEATRPELAREFDAAEPAVAEQLRRMEAAGAVDVDSEREADSSGTVVVLTEEGKALFEDHVRRLEARIDALE